MKKRWLFVVAWLGLLGGLALGSLWAQNGGGATVLDRDQASAVLPATVFFRGQTATIQARNSAGVKFADGNLMLASIVDTSGYSSGIQAKYQAYLLTEVPLVIGDQKLAAGAYGFGFVGDRMVVMDLGAHDVLTAATTHDPELKRPTPLQIMPDARTGAFRLYLGRNYVTVRR